MTDNIRYYYIPPPYTKVVYEYQDLNKNKTLRNDVTKFFQDKILKWISTDPKFKNFNKKFINSSDGFNHIYQLLKHFIKKSGLNWYELREKNYHLVKKYLKNKL